MKRGWYWQSKQVRAQALDRSCDIVIKPLMTEKTTLLGESNYYSFIVNPKATKSEIKCAIENLFKVKVVDVKTMNCTGKIKRFRGRLGKRSDTKKSIVRLAEGHVIEQMLGA
jgi:large subunit ribosomal protein L23